MKAAQPPAAWLLPLLLAAFYALFLTHKINLVTADLGRHIKNGELFFNTFSPLKTNYYSYTEPDFPALNHHWGSGVIFYLLYKCGGFEGLELFFVAVSILTLLLFYDAARRAAATALACLVVMPLLAERTEIRPEALSYLFCGIFFWVLSRWRDGEIRERALWALPFLEIIWVNCHIYFFLGPALVTAFFLEEIVRRDHSARTRSLGKALLLCAGASALNPFGIRGALAPLHIFQNYGYLVAENQPVWFIENLVRNPNFLIFKIVFALLAASFLAAWLRDRRGLSPAEVLIGAAVSAMGWLAVRNFTLFGFFAAPLLARNIAVAFPGLRQGQAPRRLGLGAIALCAALMAATSALRLQASLPYWRQFGLGLEPGNSAAAEFFKREGMTGPVLNNYDIGGYLIFHLFPRERVFVDNRPEAYSEGFFEKTYVPLQGDERVWQELQARYGFNAIFFHRRDATPWGQSFLIRRVEDPRWAPVFVDDYCLILVRRNPQNAGLIARYEIAKSRFSRRR